MFDSVGYLLKSILDRCVGGGAANSMFDLRTHSLQEDATLHCLVNLHLGWQHGVAICGLVYILYRSIWLELFICFLMYSKHFDLLAKTIIKPQNITSWNFSLSGYWVEWSEIAISTSRLRTTSQF